MALYRKYRPASFAEVVGQEHVTEPLSTALDTGRISHAYLFSGPRGCGKTSSARILARSLNCVEGPTSRPCGVCGSCVALGPGGPGNLDVIELDAASHGGVDDTRELRDRAFYAPAESRYRVFIVDEAHMVTTAGFNALLKIVEEPPAHLIFVFATTEPDKVLPTIRSRTHHYPFRLLPPATMRGLLGTICEQEGVPVEEAVYPLVIRAGGGSPRDSLSVLDQLLAGAGPEGVTYPRALSLLGVTDIALIDEAIEALANDDGAALFGTVDSVVEAGHDPRRFAGDLLERLRDLILLRAVPDAADRNLVTGPGDVLERMRDQAQRLGPAALTRYAELLHEGLGEMRGATAPRLLLEVICARMLLPVASDSESATLQRLERLERQMASGAIPTAPTAAAPTRTPAEADERPAPPAERPQSGPPRRRGAEALAAIRENRTGSPQPASNELDSPAQRPHPAQRAQSSGAESARVQPNSDAAAVSSARESMPDDVSAMRDPRSRSDSARPDRSSGAESARVQQGSDAAAVSSARESMPDDVSAMRDPRSRSDSARPDRSSDAESARVHRSSDSAARESMSDAVRDPGQRPQPDRPVSSSGVESPRAQQGSEDVSVTSLRGAMSDDASGAVSRMAADSQASAMSGPSGQRISDDAREPAAGASRLPAEGDSAAFAGEGRMISGETRRTERSPGGDTAADAQRRAAEPTRGVGSDSEPAVPQDDSSYSASPQPSEFAFSSGVSDTEYSAPQGDSGSSASFEPDRSSSGSVARERAGHSSDDAAQRDRAADEPVAPPSDAGSRMADASAADSRMADAPQASRAEESVQPPSDEFDSGAVDSGYPEEPEVPDVAEVDVPQEQPAVGGGNTLQEVEAAWGDIRAKVREFGAAVHALLSGASVGRMEGDTVVLAHQHAPLAQRLANPKYVEAVESAIEAVLGRRYGVRWEVAGASSAPAKAEPAARPQPAQGRSGPARSAEPPKFTRPSQARGAAADTGAAPRAQRPTSEGSGERSGGGSVTRATPSNDTPPPPDDDIPLPDGPDLPDDPGPQDYSPVGYDGVPPASTPEEEREMLAESAHPVPQQDRRDPDEVALELLRAELGATRLEA